VLCASLVLLAQGNVWVVQVGSVSAVSIASVSVIYVMSQYRFRSSGYADLSSLVLGVLFANAFLQCYEIVYSLTWDLSGVVKVLGGFTYDPPSSFTGTDLRMLLLWLVMASPILLVRQHLRFSALSAVLLSLTGVVWLVWVLYGFPQYYLTGYFFPQVLKTADSYGLSLWLNFGSKALMAAFFVSILEPLNALRRLLERGTRSRHRRGDPHSVDGLAAAASTQTPSPAPIPEQGRLRGAREGRRRMNRGASRAAVPPCHRTATIRDGGG
jgi:hypothetical protein